MKRLFALSILMMCSAVFSQSERSQVEFVASVTAVNRIAESTGLLSMQLTDSYALSVRVTPRTEIRDENDYPFSLSELEVGMKLKIEGMFTDEGILANEVKVTQNQHEFEIKGALEAVRPGDRAVTVAGLPIPLSATVEIKSEDGRWLSLDDLQLGQFVYVEGSIVGGAFQAREVKVETFASGKSRLNFVGSVGSHDDDRIMVQIQGVGPALVRISATTVIRGDLVEGASVRVFGAIGSDLSVEATEIQVRKPILVNPDELHLSPTSTGRADVFLSSPMDSDTLLTLTSTRPGVASPRESTLLIPSGKVNASFEVLAGTGEGSALIEVRLAAAPGGAAALLEVEVESGAPEIGDDNGGHGAEDGLGGGNGADDNGSGGTGSDDPGTPNPGAELLEISFSPNEIRGATGQSTMVQLVLNQTAPTDIPVVLSLVEGLGQPVSFPASLTIAANSRFVEFSVTTGALTGDAKIRAQLPAESGGDAASLKVRVRK